MNGTIVLCDREQVYAVHLQEYLTGSGKILCPVCIYTDADLLLERQKPEETLLLVIAESAYQPAVAEKGFRKILILSETSRLLSESWPVISKYQSMEHILEAVLETAGQDVWENARQIRHAGAMQLIGFFTPVSRCLQTSFALSLGTVLGEAHRVLYLNFEPWPALTALTNGGDEGNIRDLLYLNGIAREKAAAGLGQLLRQAGGLDLIPPMEDCLQLQTIEAKEWLDLLETIRQVSEYEYVLLDLTEAAQGVLDLLLQCSRIYTIQREDAIAAAQMKAYENLLRTHHAEEIAARTRFLEFPVFPELPVRLEDYSRGPLAECAREELRRWRDERNRES